MDLYDQKHIGPHKVRDFVESVNPRHRTALVWQSGRTMMMMIYSNIVVTMPKQNEK